MRERQIRQRFADLNVSIIKIGMSGINLAAVLFVSVFIYRTTRQIGSHFIAREFIEQVDALPDHPFWLIIVSVLLFGLILLCILLRTFRQDSSVTFPTLIIESLAAIILVWLFNFNYNGILLLVFSDFVDYVKGNKSKYILMFFAIAIFLIADYEVIAINYQLFSIKDYMSIYNATAQQYYMGIYTLLNSANIAMFIIYSVYVIQRQQATIDEVNELYRRLSEVNEDLENANMQLQEYAVITEKMGETRERNRLAREIHDTLGHTLTGISAGLDACITTIEKEPEETKARLEHLAEITREGIREVRRSVNELRPDALQRLNLEYAIQSMITNMTQTTDIKVFFQSDLKRMKFDEDEENALYRIVQEGLTNAIRHGRATKVWIQLEQQGTDILLQIRDNGIGAEEIKAGFGTKHIRERVEMLHGTVTFDGSDGFVIQAEIPIRWGEDYD